MSIWGAVGSVGAGIASSAMNLYGQERQNDQTVKNYKHRHQWEVRDLKKAGLNPILSAGGNPPSPAGAPMAPASFDNPVPSFHSAKIMKEQGRQAHMKSTVDQSNSNLQLATNEAIMDDPEAFGAYVRSKIFGQGNITSAANVATAGVQKFLKGADKLTGWSAFSNAVKNTWRKFRHKE